MREHLGGAARFVELEGLGHNEIIVRMGTDDDRLLGVVMEIFER
jgi:hypothetical protein